MSDVLESMKAMYAQMKELRVPPFHLKMSTRTQAELIKRLGPVVSAQPGFVNSWGNVEVIIDESIPFGVAEKHPGNAPRPEGNVVMDHPSCVETLSLRGSDEPSS